MEITKLQASNDFTNKKLLSGYQSNGNGNGNNPVSTDNQQSSSNIQNQFEDEAFKVYVRVRPLNKKEYEKKNQRKHLHIVKIQDNMIFVMDPDVACATSYSRDKCYAFDYVFGEEDKTSFVYKNTMEPLIGNILNGYNATLFAYGMTGAGKTHTLFGDMQREALSPDLSGMVMLTFKDIFNQISKPSYSNAHEFVIKMSYLEIYNEHVKDLLKGDNQNLMIIEDPVKGVFVADLVEMAVNSLKEVLNHILLGNSRRTMASTAANQFSSRSHAIIQVLIEKKNKSRDVTDTFALSKLSLIDLAGSERATVTDNKGLRMLEGANINRSLLSLGNCINVLSDQGKKGVFVPYRDSKLTRLLKDSLGGNTKTIMVACISPASSCYEETVNTLKYASRAKNIKRKIEQNVKEFDLNASQYKDIIENLKEEIVQLKEQLKSKPNIESPKMQNFIKTKNPSPTSTPHIFINLKEKNLPEAKYLPIDYESQYQDISKEIFKSLEKSWEINQMLRELNEMEIQNKQALMVLQKKLECTSQSELRRLEYINQQITVLKNTMLNKEKYKKDIENTLKINLIENKKLKERLALLNSSIDTHEDVKFAKRLLDIEALDLYLQNIELKKESLAQFKERFIRDQQISKMHEEIKIMRKQMEEFSKQYMLNKESNKNEIIDNDTNDKEFLRNKNYNGLNNVANVGVNGLANNYSSKNQPDLELKTSTTFRKELQLNGPEKKMLKLVKDPDEKISSPSNSLIRSSNLENSMIDKSKKQPLITSSTSLPINNSNSKRGVSQSIQPNDNINNVNNSSTVFSPIIEKVIYPQGKNIKKIMDRPRLNDCDSNPDLKDISSQSPQIKSMHYKNQLNIESKQDLNNLLIQYPQQKILSQKDDNRYPVNKNPGHSNIRPFSPTLNHESGHSALRNQNISREGFKTKRSNENSQEISLLTKEENLENFNPLCNVDNQKENININKVYTTPVFEKKAAISSVQHGLVKLSNTNKNLGMTSSQALTQVTNPTSPTESQHRRTGSQEIYINPVPKVMMNNKAYQSTNSNNAGESNSNILLSEYDSNKTKQQAQCMPSNTNIGNSCVSQLNNDECLSKGSQVIAYKSNEMNLTLEKSKLGISMGEKSLNNSLNYGSQPYNFLINKNATPGIGGSFIDQSLPSDNLNSDSKRICEIRSLEQERENLKLFRSKICALSRMNLHERNVSITMLKEIKNLIEEYKVKNYVIPTKDQECLRSLGELSLKINNVEELQDDKETRVRFASVNLTKQGQPDNGPGKTSSVTLQPPINEYTNLIPVKKIMIKDFVNKPEGENKPPEGTTNRIPLNSGRTTNTNTSHVPLRTTISLANDEKTEMNPSDSSRNILPRSIKSYSVGVSDQEKANRRFKQPPFEILDTQNDFFNMAAYKANPYYAMQGTDEKLVENFVDLNGFQATK